MVFCGRCGRQHGFPMSSVRTNRSPCEICGGYDKINIKNRGEVIQTRDMPNYSYPSNLLPTPMEAQNEGG